MGLEQNPPLAGVSPAGKAEGLFVDLLDEVARLEGWQIEYISCPMADCLARLEDQRLDLMAPLAWSPERAHRFLFSSNDIVTNWGVIYSRPNQHLNSFLDLQDLIVGGVANDIHFQRLHEQLEAFGISVNYHAYATFDEVFKALERGDVQAGVVGRFFAMKQASAYKIEATPIIFNPIHVHLAMAPKVAPQVVEIINRRIAELKNQPDSVYHRSIARWLYKKNGFSLPVWLKALIWSLAGASLLMAGFILMLREAVRSKTKSLQQNQTLLREKNVFLETLFSSIPFEVWVQNCEGQLILQNQLHAAHYGEEPGSSLQDPCAPAPLARNWLLYREQVLHGESLDLEVREGDRIYRKIMVPINESGQVTACFGLNIEVTERYRILEQLHDSERRFKMIFDEAPFILTLKDLQTSTYLDVNRYYCRFNNVSKDDVIGKTPTAIAKFISPEEHQRINALLQQNGSVDIQNIIITRADGEQRVGLISCRIVRFDGKPRNLTVIQDITDLKTAEDALKAKENQPLQLVDRAPLGIAMTDGETIRYANEGFARMIGQGNPVDTQGQPIHQYFSPDWQTEIRNRAARRMQGEDLPANYETIGMRLDGSLFPVQLSVVFLQQQGEQRLLIFFRDLTSQKQQRELLIQNEKMLMIGGLAAGMAHEINNPLGIISQNLQNLERRLSPELFKNRQIAADLGLDLKILQQYLEEREIVSYLSSIRGAIRRTSRIIENMLQFSRQGDAGLKMAPLDEVIDHAIELAKGDYALRKDYGFPNIALQRAYAPDLPQLPMNVTEIEQVLINLLKNAAQAMAGWSGERRIRISTQRDGDFALLTLCDTGPGMADHIRLRIFDPFFTTKPVGSGTGLGLSVSHAIISKNHRGSISVESSPGQGCCFTIRLPFAQDTIHA